MNGQELQALKKKLLEWAGFEEVIAKETKTIKVWKYPDGRECMCDPDFPESLDACFKWLVPKLGELNFRLELSLTAFSDINDYKIGRGFGTKIVYAASIYIADYSKLVSQEVKEKDPALALCLAIEKLIDKGGLQ